MLLAVLTIYKPLALVSPPLRLVGGRCGGGWRPHHAPPARPFPIMATTVNYSKWDRIAAELSDDDDDDARKGRSVFDAPTTVPTPSAPVVTEKFSAGHVNASAPPLSAAPVRAAPPPVEWSARRLGVAAAAALGAGVAVCAPAWAVYAR